MKKIKGYKLVALVYFMVTIVNILWICNYKAPNINKETVKNENHIVLNYEK